MPALPKIKGYFPLRLLLPSSATTTPSNPLETSESQSPKDSYYTTFCFLKENVNKTGHSNSSTLFVTNCPSVPGIPTQTFLRALFQRFGDVETVVVVPNPRRGAGGGGGAMADDTENVSAAKLWTDTVQSSLASSDGRFVNESGESCGKFAHVQFTSGTELKRALKMMTRGENAVVFASTDLEALRETETTTEETDGLVVGAEALLQRYQSRIMSRTDLTHNCNQVMLAFETMEEEAQRQRDETAAQEQQVDADGFITVSYGAPTVGSKLDLDNDAGGRNLANFEDNNKAGYGRKVKLGSRKRKKQSQGDITRGSVELQDFYRFQSRENKKRGVQELRQRFEQDLEKVKRMKDQKKMRVS